MNLTLATDDTGGPEIFASLQGEGPSQGVPVAFVRLSRCNLACVWCDTAYTWHFEGDNRPHRDGTTFERRANQVTLSPAETATRIAALGQNRLVITGGEPLLQAGALAEMLAHLPDMSVEIETNGTVAPPARLDIRVDQYNVSPKLAHSGNPADLALIPERLDAWATDPRAFLKFVIAAPEDVAEVLELQRRYRFRPERVFLMAEGTSTAAQRERQAWLSDLCLQHGFRMSDRLHIHLYGDTRGT
ncbi:7-carboxy-7-deazaguanine synthase QueE [Porphyrobacter sp. AAP60]|uniref:7-carboxy-7-deazaguanine synthase QueE n=1 Tax=Porphyrobacter sp. AAP60 TaxID=1523423 RepID=UPI0006B909B3|nr:7-carboxy-7-deazaguanine synthase QueE [Porphyrobacter sp. AAP60]KPF62893.1 pyrroloquinoline quinone biosynthesis protein PqqE [Porphyrobacter sp. AAP60]